MGEASANEREESDMHATTAAIDLAKNVFQVAIADADNRVVQQHRLSRTQFERFFANRQIDRIVMEAWGSAHHWARTFSARGIEVILLPAQYVRAYVRRNKTDAADARALLEAARDRELRPVRVKSIEQQALQALHRTRSRWMATRTARINTLRGFCREFGLHIPVGARTGLEAITRAVADEQSPLPQLLRPTLQALLDEIRVLEARIAQLERQLSLAAAQSESCKLLMTIPGVGLLSATAIAAATSGNVSHFTDARHFASWFGLTPKESSSGSTRRIGRISKRGDKYLRMLLTHGARSVLQAARVAATKGRSPGGIRHWALQLQARSNHNKAACALANKLARICYGVLRDRAPFGQPATRLGKKLQRQAFGLAH
jgi:transposase